MRLINWHVEGFGVFCDAALPEPGLDAGFNVVIGPNGAGKSTLLDFLRFTAFGYPQRRVARREPLRGGNHGGTLIYEFGSAHFRLTRTPGRDGFSLVDADAAAYSADDFRRHVGHLSEQAFGSIFAFSLSELQDAESLNAENVRDLIFEASIGRTAKQIAAAQRELQARADALFKPGARANAQNAPRAVLLARDLEDAEATLRAAREASEAAAASVTRRDELEAERKLVDDRLVAERAETTRLRNFARGWEPLRDCESAHAELTGLSTVAAETSAPADWERLKNGAELQAARAREVAQEIEQFEAQLAELPSDFPLLASAAAASQLVRLKAEFDAVHERRVEFEVQLAAIQGDWNTIREQLGSGWSEDAIAGFDVSLLAEDEARRCADAIAEAERALESARQRAGQERQRLDEAVQSAENHLEQVRLQIDLAAPPGSSDPHATLRAMLAAVAIVACIGGVVLLIRSERVAGGVALAAACALAAAWWFLQPAAESAPRRSAGDEALRHAEERAVSALKAAQSFRDDACAESAALDAARTAWADFLQRRSIPVQTTPETALNLLVRVAEGCRVLRQLSEKRAQIGRCNDAASAVLDRVCAFLAGIGRATEQPFIELESVCEEIARQREQQSKRESLTSQLVSRTRTAADRAKDAETAVEMRDQFLQVLGVSDEAALRRLFESAATRRALEEKMRTANATLVGIFGANGAPADLRLAWESGLRPDWEGVAQRSLEAADSAQSRRDDLLREAQTLGDEIARQLQSDAVAAAQLAVAQIRGELHKTLDEWTELAAALDLLRRTREKFEGEHQSPVLEEAGRLFAIVTGGVYVRMVMPLASEQDLVVIAGDGSPQAVHTLSRGTMEQLYLCLRLGYIRHFQKQQGVHLPLLMDDIAVNFDPERLAAVFAVIGECCRDGQQVLFFTCHPNVCALANPNRCFRLRNFRFEIDGGA